MNSLFFARSVEAGLSPRCYLVATLLLPFSEGSNSWSPELARVSGGVATVATYFHKTKALEGVRGLGIGKKGSGEGARGKRWKKGSNGGNTHRLIARQPSNHAGFAVATSGSNTRRVVVGKLAKSCGLAELVILCGFSEEEFAHED